LSLANVCVIHHDKTIRAKIKSSISGYLPFSSAKKISPEGNMPKTQKRLFIRLLASVSMLSLGLTVQAQDTNQDSEAITEVVVTGVAKGTNRLNTSISVSSVDVDTLAKFALDPPPKSFVMSLVCVQNHPVVRAMPT